MQNLSGKVRLGKVYLNSNYKDCNNVKSIFPWTTKVDLCLVFYDSGQKILKIPLVWGFYEANSHSRCGKAWKGSENIIKFCNA